jgi:hypothetical protein
MLFNNFYVYCGALIALSIILGFSAFWIWGVNPENLEKREKTPRLFAIGAVLAIIDIAWVAPQTYYILPANYRALIIPGSILAAFLALKYLDYLFSRALGGFFILLAHYLLHDSFTFHTPFSPLFAVFCFAIGIVGLFFAGKPYLFRDFIRKAAKNKNLKFASISYLSLYAIFCLAVGIIHICRGQI